MATTNGNTGSGTSAKTHRTYIITAEKSGSTLWLDQSLAAMGITVHGDLSVCLNRQARWWQ